MTDEKPTTEPDVLDKLVLLLVSLRDRRKVAEVAVAKLGVPPAAVHALISSAFEKIREAASFDTEEQAGQAIFRLNDLYERSLKVQDCKTALSCQKELTKLQDLYSALKRRRQTIDPGIMEAMKP